MIDEIFLAARERDNILDRDRCGLPKLDQDDWPTDARLLAHKRDLERNYVVDQKMRIFVNVQNVWRKAGRSLLRKLRMLDCENLESCPKEGHIYITSPFPDYLRHLRGVLDRIHHLNLAFSFHTLQPLNTHLSLI